MSRLVGAPPGYVGYEGGQLTEAVRRMNRVDEIVLFKPLTLGEIELIVDLLLNDLRARVVTEPALRFIAEQGLTLPTAPDRCGVSLPARLRPGSGKHRCAVTFTRAARSLLIL